MLTLHPAHQIHEPLLAAGLSPKGVLSRPSIGSISLILTGSSDLSVDTNHLYEGLMFPAFSPSSTSVGKVDRRFAFLQTRTSSITRNREFTCFQSHFSPVLAAFISSLPSSHLLSALRSPLKPQFDGAALSTSRLVMRSFM